MPQQRPVETEAARVVRQLRAEILEAERPPGQRLVERELAEELGVSRVPVRDALRALVGEGLVTARPRSWAVVREFTASDVADLNEVRAVFEPLAFRLAAQRRTAAGLRQLRVVVEAELAAARTGDARRARRAAADFHETVSSLAANELLSELEGAMRGRMRWLLGRHDDLLLIAEQHDALYDAISARDVARVEALVEAHLVTGRAMATAHRSP